MHICKSTMENCQNLYDSYGMICVGCNCCGELNKETMWQCRYDATVRRLQNNAMELTDDFFKTEIQQLNIVSSIVSECEDLKEIIKHLDLEKGVGITEITDLPFAKGGEG